MQPEYQKPMMSALHDIEMTKFYAVGGATIIGMVIACEVKVGFPFLFGQ
jgi:hypothetical protein